MLLALTLFGTSYRLDRTHAALTRAEGVGTACCGIAPSMNTLLAARAVAGMGAAGESLPPFPNSSDINAHSLPLLPFQGHDRYAALISHAYIIVLNRPLCYLQFQVSR